ncbi:MAG TPA: GntR family transcriptional regulator [Candidatus Scybalocola faecipullorum]|nr:GntR family transcriptional regulator [Candidatus Scybalocola faecipullorum]
MQELDTTSIVPLYKQLKDLILKEIEEGRLKPNQKIPTELELSERYQISRMTVRKSLAQLVDEGILAKKQGKGTFVQEPKMTEDLSSPNSFTNLCKRNGKVPGGRTLKFILEEATDRDMKELKLEPGEQVIRVERLRLADNMPVMLENLYFPGHLKNILVENLDDTSLYQILHDKYGLVTGNSVMEFEISEANSYEAALMEIRAGSPLLLVREIVYDQYGQPLHRTKSLLRGDKFKYISPRMNVIKN